MLYSFKILKLLFVNYVQFTQIHTSVVSLFLNAYYYNSAKRIKYTNQHFWYISHINKRVNSKINISTKSRLGVYFYCIFFIQTIKSYRVQFIFRVAKDGKLRMRRWLKGWPQLEMKGIGEYWRLYSWLSALVRLPETQNKCNIKLIQN